MKNIINRKKVVMLRIEAAERIRRYRLDEGLSIMELVDRLSKGKCKISRQSIHDWETEKTIPTVRIIHKIESALRKEFI